MVSALLLTWNNDQRKFIMKKILLLSACIAFSLSGVSVSFAGDPMTPEACTAEFTKADANKDGQIAPQEGDFYLKAAEGNGTKMDATSITTKEQFVAECVKGIFH
jgi:hypothetical protein